MNDEVDTRKVAVNEPRPSKRTCELHNNIRAVASDPHREKQPEMETSSKTQNLPKRAFCFLRHQEHDHKSYTLYLMDRWTDYHNVFVRGKV